MKAAATPMLPLRAAGFSLMEMAVVLMITGILLSGLMAALGQSAESARRSNAQAQLRRAEDALYGFAQANGRLPCPAVSTSAGQEAPVGGGDCTSYHGFLPAVTLGLHGSINADGLLLDPWQNPLRYSVASLDTANGRAFTSSLGLNWLYNNNALAAGPDVLRVCDASGCGGTVLADSVPAIIVSMGADWPSFSSADEIENGAGAVDGGYSITNTNDFVSTTYVEDVFDDLPLWLSPHILYGRLITAGKLP